MKKVLIVLLDTYSGNLLRQNYSEWKIIYGLNGKNIHSGGGVKPNLHPFPTSQLKFG